MTAIFDTSSFFNLVKYYLPLDKHGEIRDIIKLNYEVGEIRVIDKVIEECGYTAKGLVLNNLEFLKSKSLHIKTEDILPSTAFFNFVDREFCDAAEIKAKDYSKEQIEMLKTKYLESADCKLMLYAQSILSENPFIVTEESVHGNDGKVHRKIPYNCQFLSIKCCTLPEFLNEYFSLTISKFKGDNSTHLDTDNDMSDLL
jgi:hypothetical protein